MRRTSPLVSLVSLLLLLACKTPPAVEPQPLDEKARWAAHVSRVTITRDDWGIPHVRGERDADAVFGLMYAQAEDDFPRIEQNYLNALGRLAEADGVGEGEKALFQDLRMRLYIDPVELQALERQAPPWLQALLAAWADGLNYYLHTHPQVQPRLLTRFEPWMALAFSEGSIGGDIERISIEELTAFYGGTPPRPEVLAAERTAQALAEPTGSNGFAIAPSRSASGNALLLINPHTSFFFREEAQVQSGEGLNAYGALTWGQFFVYQGFNEHTAWMHTSSGVDNIDEYLETIVEKPGANGPELFSRHGGELRPVRQKQITLRYRMAGPASPAGQGDPTALPAIGERTFTVFHTQHGPVVRAAGGKWVAVALMHKPLDALMQSYRRTKTRGYDEFRAVMDLHANSSNNTVFADSSGTIAYFHANFVPRREPAFDWTQPVDGADPRTAWSGVHSIEESPDVKNPPGGWIQNANNWPYSSAGPDSPKRERFPAYFDSIGETPRGVAAQRVLSEQPSLTLESLIAAAYDPRMPELEAQVPLLVRAWEETPAQVAFRAETAEAIALLRGWDFRWSLSSVPTTLAVLWAERLWRASIDPAKAVRVSPYVWMRTKLTALQRLEALAEVMRALTADFGRWQVAWGEINRFQRVSPAIEHPFDDAAPSTPVAFAPGRWGSLASFAVPPDQKTRKRYGTSGNSFVAVVELGKGGVRARAVTAGGLSNDVTSKHFNDQASRYAAGALREVYFTAAQLAGHTERTYRPGE